MRNAMERWEEKATRDIPADTRVMGPWSRRIGVIEFKFSDGRAAVRWDSGESQTLEALSHLLVAPGTKSVVKSHNQNFMVGARLLVPSAVEDPPVLGTLVAYGNYDDYTYVALVLLENRTANFANYAVGKYHIRSNEWTEVQVFANIVPAVEAYRDDYGMDV